ncbi:hypothetical protein phiCTP1_gp34 [Clostridium phage phiCTP1]|uniref:hypothetical protein n=1 Tax=Clostridium phage phiCTP1 TaxID=871584 RepID=UPI0001E07830|nr:hypothetical protein phiCTP1_gp34 [Clostridium phage phiCTP1]ADL40335.1 hypothetical phage protein [Clostridium phage phiCTP1]WMU07966.1 hypothetical protein vBCtySFA88_00034 [Clostridium phage vB_CtyS-FA88]
MLKDNINYLRIGEVAKRIDKTTQTIKSWYGWAEFTGDKEIQSGLPTIYRFDKRGTRYFKESDIPQLEKWYNKYISYGTMSNYLKAKKK